MRAFLAALAIIFAVPVFAQGDLAVRVSGSTPADYSNHLNSTNRLVARFELEATGADVQVDDVTVHFSNETMADEAFSAIRLYYDANGNGTLEGTEQVGTDAVPNGSDAFATFTGTFTALAGLIRDLYVQVDIGNDPASYGQEFTFRIDADVSLTLNNGTDTVSGAFPVTANTLTIRHSENEIVPGTGNPSAPRTVHLGSNNVGVLHFIVASLTPTPPGQLSGIDLSSITITVTVGNSAQTAIVERLTLWQDDGNGSFNPGSGEVLIQERTPADIGSWTVAGSVINVTFSGSPVQLLSDIPSGGAKALWVGIDFGDGPESVCEVSVSRTNVVGALGTDADFFVTATTNVNGDVITISEKPPPGRSYDPPGEGGCSTGEGTRFNLFVLTFVLAVFALGCRAVRCKRGRGLST